MNEKQEPEEIIQNSSLEQETGQEKEPVILAEEEKAILEKERDDRTAERLKAELSAIEALEPSGDIKEDINRFMRITGRNYKADKEPAIVAYTAFVKLKEAMQATMPDPARVEGKHEAKRLFFVDIPQAETEAAGRIISFYSGHLDKLSERDLDMEFDDGVKKMEAEQINIYERAKRDTVKEKIANRDWRGAETEIDEIKNNRNNFPGIDDREIDHMEVNVFRGYRDQGSYDEAIRFAKASIKPGSRDGRLKNLSHILKKPVEEL